MDKSQVTAVVLAGGRGRRMDGIDKGLFELSGRPMIAHVLERLRPQVGAIVISANRNLEAYRSTGWPVVTDVVGEYLGPLAGIVSGLEAAATPLVLTVPCDAPRLPADLRARLHGGLEAGRTDVAVAHDGNRAQRAFLFLRRHLSGSIRDYLERGGRSIEGWLARHAVAEVDFSDCPGAFMNVNTRAEAAELQRCRNA